MSYKWNDPKVNSKGLISYKHSLAINTSCWAVWVLSQSGPKVGNVNTEYSHIFKIFFIKPELKDRSWNQEKWTNLINKPFNIYFVFSACSGVVCSGWSVSPRTETAGLPMCVHSTGELPVRRCLFIWSSCIFLPSWKHSVAFHPWAEWCNVKQTKGVLRRVVTCLCLCALSSQPENLCILNVGLGLAVSMSLCSFQAGLCHSDPLFFIHEGACDPADVAKVEWAKFRASLASNSSIQQPCGLDTCYEWETCSGEG